jgi:hypothetical protein
MVKYQQWIAGNRRMKPIFNDYSQPIDWNDELTACTELLEQSWNVSRLSFNEGHERVDQTPARRLVELVFEKAAQVGENGYVGQDLRHQFHSKVVARKEYLMSEGCSSSIDLFDGIAVMLSRLSTADIGKPLHDAVLNGLRERIDQEISGVDFIAPLNYGAFMTHFRQSDDLRPGEEARKISEENADILLKSFKGSESIAMSSFPEDLSMHSVGFFDKQLNYAPCVSLMSALISQSLSTKLVNNTVELCRELRAIDLRADFVEGEYKPSSARLKALVQDTGPMRRFEDEYLPMALKDYKPKGRKNEASFEP